MSDFSLGFIAGVVFVILLSVVDRILYARHMRKIYDRETIRILNDMH